MIDTNDRYEMRKLASLIADEIEKRHNAELASKWKYATVIFRPEDKTLKQHELPMEKFMHKIVMMRDNLRVLEQQVNANKNLDVGEKVKLQAYITKIYGSMTSFNFMFAEEDDKFKGASGE